MAPRLDPLHNPPVGFAHRGARAHAPENTLEAFALARRLGASGLESDAWVTADGVVVLDHDGVVIDRMRTRRRPIGSVDRADLPPHIPTLADLYDTCGSDWNLSLDVKDPNAGRAIAEVAASYGAERRLWLCYTDWQVAAALRPDTDARIVHSTRLRSIADTTEMHARRLHDAGLDALNLHYSDWSGGLCAVMHRFELFALGWDAQHLRILVELLEMGIDGVFSDHTDRMMEAISTVYPSESEA